MRAPGLSRPRALASIPAHDSLVMLVMLVRLVLLAVPMAVPHLIASEMLIVVRVVLLNDVLAALRILAMVAIAPIVVIIYVTPEIAIPAVPWSSPDEHSTAKPLRTVIAIRSAIIR